MSPFSGAVDATSMIDERARARQSDSRLHDMTHSLADCGPPAKQRSEDHYRRQLEAVCNNATVALFIMNEKQHCVYMNPAAETMTGFQLEEVRNRALHDVIHYLHPDGTPYPLEECPIDRVLPQNDHEQGEDVFVHKNGSFYPVAYTASPIRENGTPIGTIIEVRNISREKEAEQVHHQLLKAEREAREQSEALWRIGQIIAAELDVQKIVQAVTDAATEATGARFGAFFYNVVADNGEAYTLYTLSGAPREAFETFPMPRATALFGPTFRGEGTVRIDDVKKDARYGKNSPYRGMPAGHLPVTSYLATPVFSRSGEVIGGLFFGHEDAAVFTERDEQAVEALATQASIAMDNAQLFDTANRERAKAEAAAKDNERLYKEAEQANRMKDEFLAVVSHELRTPLTAILGWTEMLLSGMLDSEAQQMALRTIERSARSQTQIIEDILDISRIVTGKLRLDVRLVEPAVVIEAAVQSLRPAADAKGIRLQTTLDPCAGPISGDFDRLQQIVWNLVSNAVKFTPRNGRVQVRLERVNSHLEITVSDTGHGIAPEFLPHVFERFRQADSSYTRTFGGLGLGLAIVRQLTELHGGTVAVASPGVGQGSTFTISLPVAVIHQRSDTPSPERVHPAAGGEPAHFECLDELEGLHVLIVDDEEDTRILLRTILESCKVVVTDAATALSGVESFSKERPDIIISDIGMPDVDGFEFIRRIRAVEREHKLERIPAIALTAYARAEDRMRALSAGYQMHIPKPVEPAELVTVISSLTGRLPKNAE